MTEAGIDFVLFTSYHNINYYSDFLYCQFGRNYGLAVSEENATSISANIDGGQPWRRTVGDNLIYTDWQRDNYVRAVQQLIADGATVGIEFDQVTLQNRDKLQAALPAASFVDISPATMRMRMVKSAEIEVGDDVVMDMPQLIEIKNGDKVKGTFSAEEMSARLARLRAHMAEAGIDFVLFTSYHNINYYSRLIISKVIACCNANDPSTSSMLASLKLS